MIEFKLVDIISDDIVEHSEDYTKCFFLTLYGKTLDNQSIICNVSHFRPFFYIKIPDKWTTINNGVKDIHKTKIKTFLNIDPKTKSKFDNDIKGIYDNEFISKHGGDPINDFISFSYVSSKEFYGFQCDKDKKRLHFSFLKISFSSQCSIHKVNYCGKDINSTPLKKDDF